MRTRGAGTLVLVAAGVLLGIALGVKWMAVRSARDSAAALARLDARRATLDEAIRRTRARIAADERDRIELQAGLSSLERVAAAGSAATARSPVGPGVAALLAANPSLFNLGVRAYRANLGSHYQQLYRALALSPGQIEAFEDLMTEHEEGLLDLEATAASQGIGTADPAFLALRQQQDDQLRAAQIALLGETGYRQLQQLARMQPVQDLVANLATTVALTDTPLGGAQAAEVAGFLANSSSSYRAGDPADPATIDWDVALPQARAVLSDAQYSALKAEALKPKLDKMREQFSRQAPANP
jgi:hypothetical protein